MLVRCHVEGFPVVSYAGPDAFRWSALLQKAFIPLVVSPTLGFVVALLLVVLLLWRVRRLNPGQLPLRSRSAQLVSASLMAFSHGSNDAQKSMGIITLALVSFVASGGGRPSWLPGWVLPGPSGSVPTWVILVCATASALGTAAGGKRITKTIGNKIIRIAPLQGFAAGTAGAVCIMAASYLGIPISTTHCISACLMGVGPASGLPPYGGAWQ